MTGTGPKMFYQASAPTSGMSAGDIWVKTATTAPTSGNYSVFTPNTNFSVAFTEDIAYVTYARTMSGVTNFTCNGTKNGTSLSVSYNIYYLLNDPQTTNDYNATFTYKLEFVDTAGTVTSIVSSSKSVAHGASGNVTATVSKTVADLDGYFRLTYTMSLPHMMGEDNSGNDDGSGSPAKATGTIRSANLFSGGPSTSGAYWTELWYYTSNGWRR
ncbi:MAG: hypothetical protein J6V44_07585 [Methanobrevibacter sp.]|nr:hypothetical protein [Methanobrevibacter sp.]